MLAEDTKLKRIEMSDKEINRVEMVSRLADGLVSQRIAAEKLKLSERQVRRLQRAYEAEGATGLVSKRRCRASNRRIDDAVKAAVLGQVQTRYADFGPTLAAEYLKTDGYAVSKETLRQWMIAGGFWQATKGRRKTLHPPRARRPRCGELIQIDGSPHAWLEARGARCTLIAFIDDASSRVMSARFVPVESSQAYLECLRVCVTAYGCPAALYSDRHGIFTKHDPEDDAPTQFQRAIGSLGIVGIQALTPQAKGRVERLFQTLQDRLVKALRLANINDMAAANAFLPAYLAAHNARFAEVPQDGEDAHRVYQGGATELARICAIHQTRKLSKDLVLSYQRQRYIIQTHGQPRYALRGAVVTVVDYGDQRIELLHGDEILPFKVFDPPKPATPAVDEKSLNARVDDILVRRRWSEKSKPAPTHPWRRYPDAPSSGAGQLASP